MKLFSLFGSDCYYHILLFKGNSTDRGGSSNDLCASGLSVPEGKGKFFRCNFPVYGRYVYIRIPGTRKILTLCEVEVYSTITSSKMIYIR